MENNFNNLRDEDIVLLAQKGDSLAEEYIIRKYLAAVKLKCTVYFIAGGDREDVIQEGMIGIFKAINSYDAAKDATFKTYADKCVRNQIVSAIRNANRLKNTPLNDFISFDGSPDNEENAIDKNLFFNDSEDPETVTVIKEMINEIARNNNSLFSESELLVWQEYLKGHSLSEISEMHDMKYKAVDNAMQRVKKKIMDIILG